MQKKSKPLHPGQIRLVEWLATPQGSRDPKALQELAKEIGVTLSTISRWRKNLNVDEQAVEVARQSLFDHLPEVYEKLAEKAKEGSYQHTRLFLEVTSEHCQRLDITLDDRRSVTEVIRASPLEEE